MGRSAILLVLFAASVAQLNATLFCPGSWTFNISRSGSLDSTINDIIQNSISAESEIDQKADAIAKQIADVPSNLTQLLNPDLTDSNARTFNVTGQLIQAAISVGGTVAQCAQQQQTGFNNITSDVIAALGECVANKTNQGRAILSSLFQNAGNATGLSQNITQDIIACGQNNGFLFPFFNPAFYACKIGVLARATQTFTTLGAQMAQNIARAGIFIATFKIDLKICATIAAVNGTIQAAGIASNITTCVANNL